MNYRNHIIFAFLFVLFMEIMINLGLSIYSQQPSIAVLTSLFPLLSIVFWVVSTPIIIVYSLLPDIDHQHSKITTLFYSIGFFLIILYGIDNMFQRISWVNNTFLIMGVALMLIVYLMSKKMKHRGYTHTVWFGAFMSLGLYFLGITYIIYYFVAFLSYYSHLVADHLPFNWFHPKGED